MIMTDSRNTREGEITGGAAASNVGVPTERERVIFKVLLPFACLGFAVGLVAMVLVPAVLLATMRVNLFSVLCCVLIVLLGLVVTALFVLRVGTRLLRRGAGLSIELVQSVTMWGGVILLAIALIPVYVVLGKSDGNGPRIAVLMLCGVGIVWLCVLRALRRRWTM